MASFTSSDNGQSIRIIIQQCLNASLQLQSLMDEREEKRYVRINRGIVVLLCFLKGASLDMIPKAVKAVLNIKLSELPDGSKVSVLDLPGDVLIVPQATLGGKMKGKSMQYHSNIAKHEALPLYEEFTKLCQEMVLSDSKITSGHTTSPQVKWGMKS
ncbi:D-aminoacyl-tRNA deacylase 2 isoform X2 [Exaiptasia diaphana]|uniref:D-aminoacyl-tRNA deacylase n=1 Tax=Exaiptasia diaphana TaxID=2652724 RepID=A0A913X9X6_EXADI|nr:D-aminoacyl-tRNA deacylase 2 isoform X2 [Exaiptasia diaphana]